MKRWTWNIIVNSLLVMALDAGICVTANAEPMLSTYLNPNWKDVNKGGQRFTNEGEWLKKAYWNDLNNDGKWDIHEPFAASPDPEWNNVKEGDDNSCWLAATANLLASAGYHDGDAKAIYKEFIYKMVTPTHKGGWQYGGNTFEALYWYLNIRTEPRNFNIIAPYVAGPAGLYGQPAYLDEPKPQVWPTHPFEMATNALSNGAQVIITLHRGDDIWHDVVLQGFDWEARTIQITDSNLDASENGLDTYSFELSGPTKWVILDYADYGTVPIDGIIIAILPPTGDL